MLNKEAIEAIKRKLLEKKQTIAVVESVTAGLLTHALASAVDASKFFQGGLTPYNIGQKCRHLNINPIHAIECDCVSQKMAENMATECCRFFTSDWGISITGYASPTPQSNNKLYAFFAIAFGGEVLVSEKIESEENAPYEVQLYYRDKVIGALLSRLNR
jgi:PncC family amidohydrolase